MTYINCNYTNYFIAYVIIFYHYISIPFFPTVNRTNYNLRNETIKLPMTRRTFYVQSTKCQLHLLLRTTLHKYSELADTSSLYAYTSRIKTHLISGYNPNCVIPNCYVCLNT